MMPCAAVWIDRRRAYIVRLSGEGRHGATVSTIPGDEVESRRRASGGSGRPLPWHLGGGRESHDGRRREEELKRYYGRVADALAGSERVALMGPGEAHVEFERVLTERHGGRMRVVASERADYLSVSRLLARARELFGVRAGEGADGAHAGEPHSGHVLVGRPRRS